MKLLISLLIIILRLYIGFKIIQWIFFEFSQPQIHSISEIEVYLVIILFDSWINIQPQIEIEVDNRNN